MGARRGDGLDAGNCWVQVFATPSHVQVSPRVPWELFRPPNSNTVRVALSYAMPPDRNCRGDGETGGNCCVQVTPSQVQVSSREVPSASAPPKSTISPAAPSQAIAGPTRGDGDAAGNNCVHCSRKIQVSPSVVGLVKPPNITVESVA